MTRPSEFPHAPMVVVYANSAAPSAERGNGARLKADHLRYAVPLAERRGDVSGVSVSYPQHGQEIGAPSSGDFSGEYSGSRESILRQFRDQTPARWMSFLHAHFSGAQEVSAFFDVDEKTGRNWWNGVGRPTVDKALYAQMSFPGGFQDHMLPEAGRWAAE
ncbi:hypothetical protein CDZ97_10265 [Mameliella alba]|uniref:hypothetical protein n=1 Tax=Mameliella alba TaxID=561184 RepID=UPI000B52BB49|nr:hypothetical protein [Mameliella alba]OWV64262.1 hypothetical protein CDZ97_10265 [Mameliella alba]